MLPFLFVDFDKSKLEYALIWKYLLEIFFNLFHLFTRNQDEWN